MPKTADRLKVGSELPPLKKTINQRQIDCYSGVRPKIAAAGTHDADFTILGEADHGVRGLVALLGIESPGLTSSLAIGSAVAQRIAKSD